MRSSTFIAKDPQALRDLQIHFFPKLRENQKVGNATVAFERKSQHCPGGFMPLGAYSYSHSAFLADRIGRYCSIAKDVAVMGQSHPVDWVTSSPITYKFSHRRRSAVTSTASPFSFDENARPVTIGHDVWIGQNVLIKGGVTIGTGAIVAGGSVIVKDVAPYSIVGGNPAKLIRNRLAPTLAKALLALEWWRFDFDCLAHLDFSNPERFVSTFPAPHDLRELPDDRMDVFAHLGE